MFDDNQYVEQPVNEPHAQPAQNSTFAQEPVSQVTGAPPIAVDPGIDDHSAMDELAQSLDEPLAPITDPTVDTEEPTPAVDEPVAEPQQATAQASDMPDANEPKKQALSSDLLEIKQHALADLGPLLGQLDQPAAEKFKTIMMMIQASDDQNLVKDAYEAAHSIQDETARAQALLDVVNEINYFSQNSK